MRKPLTERQQEILGVIAEYRDEHGYAPSLREIGKLVGLSVAAVDHHLSVLEARGYLKRGPWGTPRSWAVIP